MKTVERYHELRLRPQPSSHHDPAMAACGVAWGTQMAVV